MPQTGFFGGTPVIVGSQTFSTPGTFSFVVPAYANSLTVTVRGAGAGGAGAFNTSSSGAGGTSYFGSAADLAALRVPVRVIADGGASVPSADSTTGSAGGTATGGDTNTTGTSGVSASGTPDGIKGAGGAGANGGGAGGDPAPSTVGHGDDGTAPGGGGGGAYAGTAPFIGARAGGGGGGCAVKAHANGVLTPGDVIEVAVGAGGTPGNGNRDGGLGGNGRVEIVWT
jgi:hypothetical protein